MAEVSANELVRRTENVVSANAIAPNAENSSLGASNREEVLAKKKKGECPKPNAILVFVDSFTRYTKLFPAFDKSADTVRRCLHKLFCELGIPGVLISDCGPAFASEAIENYLRGYDTERKITHPHLPSAHGLSQGLLDHWIPQGGFAVRGVDSRSFWIPQGLVLFHLRFLPGDFPP